MYSATLPNGAVLGVLLRKDEVLKTSGELGHVEQLPAPTQSSCHFRHVHQDRIIQLLGDMVIFLPQMTAQTASRRTAAPKALIIGAQSLGTASAFTAYMQTQLSCVESLTKMSTTVRTIAIALAEPIASINSHKYLAQINTSTSFRCVKKLKLSSLARALGKTLLSRALLAGKASHKSAAKLELALSNLFFSTHTLSY
eukprot:IDg6904t1